MWTLIVSAVAVLLAIDNARLRRELRRLDHELTRLSGTSAGLGRAIDTANKEQ